MTEERNTAARSMACRLAVRLVLVAGFLTIAGIFCYAGYLKCAEWVGCVMDYEEPSYVPVPTEIVNADKPVGPALKEAEVKAKILRCRPSIDNALLDKTARAVVVNAERFGLGHDLIISTIKRESNFNPMDVSKADCKGLMQVNPKAHAGLLKLYDVKGDEIFEVDNNVMLGCYILKTYLMQTGTIRTALYRYVGAERKDYVADIMDTCGELSNMRVAQAQ